MPNECQIKVERQIKSLALLDVAATDTVRKEADAMASLRKQQETEVQSLRLARKSLEAGADAMGRLHEKMVAGQAQQIANLAVEIARKILQGRIAENDYKIEAVIEQALKQAPVRHNVTVRLNPEDLVRCRQLQEQDGNEMLGAMEFVADPGVGRAECIVETPKGSIESYLEEHLAKVEEAIRQCWQAN
jgi:flagellar biosynthesis/type III secretory pathway protein FliH